MARPNGTKEGILYCFIFTPWMEKVLCCRNGDIFSRTIDFGGVFSLPQNPVPVIKRLLHSFCILHKWTLGFLAHTHIHKHTLAQCSHTSLCHYTLYPTPEWRKKKKKKSNQGWKAMLKKKKNWPFFYCLFLFREGVNKWISRSVWKYVW